MCVGNEARRDGRAEARQGNCRQKDAGSGVLVVGQLRPANMRCVMYEIEYYSEEEAVFVEEAAFDLCEDCDEMLIECICESHYQ